MVVSTTQERVLEGLSNSFFVRGCGKPNREKAQVANVNQAQNGPMSNMQNPSCSNLTQANGPVTTPVPGCQPLFQRNTDVLSIEQDISQLCQATTMAEYWRNQLEKAQVANVNQAQNGPMSNMQNPSCSNLTQGPVTTPVPGRQPLFQRNTDVLSIEQDISQLCQATTMAEDWSNQLEKAQVANVIQAQNGPMSNMQNPSCSNLTQAYGPVTTLVPGRQPLFQRNTDVLSMGQAISQLYHATTMAEYWSYQLGPDAIRQTLVQFRGNADIARTEPSANQVQQPGIPPHQPMNNGTGTSFDANPTAFPARIIWDMPSVVPILDQLMSRHSWQPEFKNCGLPTTCLMQERFGSLTTMPKEVMQNHQGSGVLIQSLEPDDSDEGRPQKRKLHSKYQLRFVNKVCETYYTRDQIKADEGNLLKVALFDENNTKITSGPLSSASVEVVALHGDFNGDDQNDWTSEEFNSYIVFPPPGGEVSSVLGGDHILVLDGGEACLCDAFFQRTSFCARTGKFKMGVMLASAQEERVQEGISEPLRVMDHHLPGFISNCSSWKSDLEPPVFRASTSSGEMAEDVLLDASMTASILSERVANLKELQRKVQEIGKIDMLDKATKQLFLKVDMLDKAIKQMFLKVDMLDIAIKHICTPRLTNELVKGWITEVRELHYNVEDVIDKYSYYAFTLEEENRVKKIFTEAQYIRVFSEIAEEITQIEKNIENVVKRKGQWLQQSQLSPSPSADIERKQSQDCILDVVQDDLVGIEENRRLLTEWLNLDEQSMKLITVSGLGGLGKTALVTNVYEREKNNFTAYAWIAVSQTYDVVELLRKLLREIEGTQQPQLADLDAYDLKRKINERLTGKKCLIVLDDLWNEEAYTQIMDAFQNLKPSCVIITTRQEQVAALAHPTRQLKLKPLGYSDAFSLFCRKAFCNCIDSKCPNELEKLANNIVDSCLGLPLAIVTMGGLLSALPPVKDVWNETYMKLKFQNEMKNNDHVRAILNLSYNDLPGNLRNCFLYCSLFPEDHLMSRESLVQQWVAEGFAGQNDQSTLEDVADRYFSELIQRSMLQAVENDGLGRVSTCKMHDLVHDLAYSIAKGEMYGFARDYGNIVKMDKSVRRLSSCGWKDKTLSSLEVKNNLSRLRTLVAHGITESSPQLLSSTFSGSLYLRVIDLQDSKIVEVPECIGNLFNLRYISLRSTRVKSLPESIGMLTNLQALDMRQTKIEKLPQWIGKLTNLRHLLANKYADENQSEYRYFSGVEAPEGLSNLTRLRTLETVKVGKDLAEQLTQLEQLQSLWIDNITSVDCANIFTALSKMPVLSSLLLSASDEKETLCLEALKPQSEYLHKLVIRGCWAGKTLEYSIFQEHGKYLKYLDISWCHFQEDPLQLLAPCVPNLTYLSLNRVSSASTLVLSPDCFPQLKMLVLKGMPCVEEVDFRVGALRQIECLHIESLVKLYKIPRGIEFLCSLKKLRLLDLHKEFRAQWNSKGMPQKMNYVRDIFI